jgi:hypothetical protein
VFAVVDGIGWLRRANDLRKIHQLWEENHLNGLYTISMLDAFADDVEKAATQLNVPRR